MKIHRPITRRDLLRGGAALSAYAALGCSTPSSPSDAGSDVGNDAAIPDTGWDAFAPSAPAGMPGNRPRPDLPEGAETMPQIQHIVVVMMENHSFDNYFGMLDPSVGFTLDATGAPTAACPDGTGHHVHAFRMPNACQANSEPSQAWDASHISYANGNNDGFVLASGPVAMGYWTSADIPFYYSLARNFTLASRWFSSTLCQTYPNRRFLLAATAAGITTTDGSSLGAPTPAGGTICDKLSAFGISWKDYASDVPGVAIIPSIVRDHRANAIHTIAQFMSDCAAGTLPSVAFVDPPFSAPGSEENPQDIRGGERFVSQVVNAVMQSPAWPSTVLLWLYDEHGGYYDHVPPPSAIAPDDIAPMVPAGAQPGGYDRYGFRVPAVIVSPFAKPGFVSSTVRDHTAVLRFIETKWNLGALTRRDAAADDLSDCLDLANPRLLVPPMLAAPALADPSAPTCTPGMPGTIPPPGSVTWTKTGRAIRAAWGYG
jgi:phospholipase C